MKILGVYGKETLAKVYVASIRCDDNHLIEFVESIQPPIPREDKWVLIVSPTFGCPVKCRMCDAGGRSGGKLSKDEILAQIDHMVRARFLDGKIPIPKFKIQFARMGEPSFNMAVLDCLDELPAIYDAPGLTPSISTVAPKGREEFFEGLIDIKNRHYGNGKFQFQFSLHSTSQEERDDLIPIPKWSFEKMNEFGRRFRSEGDRKITLNFAMMRDVTVDPAVVAKYFDSETFLIKITPLNPTGRARDNSLASAIDPNDSTSARAIIEEFQDNGFEVLLSIGEVQENDIGSNCGQFITLFENGAPQVRPDYKTSGFRLCQTGNE